MNAQLSVNDDGPVRTLTIERPDRRNALDDATILAMTNELAQAEADPAVRVVVLTGAGGMAFCAGSDLKAAQAMTEDQRVQHVANGQILMDRIEKLHRVVIAAVEGWALGGGFELALACDLVVAAEGAQFGLPEVQKGMLPGWGGTYKVTRTLGLSWARNMILGGQRIDAHQAAHAGLAIESVAQGDALSAAIKLGKRISENSATAQLALAKRMVDSGVDSASATGDLLELLGEQLQAKNDDYGQGR
ncbi:enoyl-CoA hydratase/isomerase family protein [Mycolicibacterium baixiangningiae]|uniref:enoyl-CoA hydratase/isomerase family protein n=1 Tax=Mycolicibacterium baixiangningiae TaxID=2761578 RepID=UPI0018683EE1|nr:enoyl-CoA hydratase/isomerase family protein [Mycolicibacterium baixiangningiae]